MTFKAFVVLACRNSCRVKAPFPRSRAETTANIDNTGDFFFFFFRKHKYEFLHWSLLHVEMAQVAKILPCRYQLTHRSYMANTMAADELPMQGARVSTAIVLIYFSQNIPVSAQNELTHSALHRKFWGHSVLPDSKPLPEPMMTKIYNALITRSQ